MNEQFDDQAAQAGMLTQKLLDECFTAIKLQGVTPMHDCRYDGHVLHWLPYSWARCIYCSADEADVLRP